MAVQQLESHAIEPRVVILEEFENPSIEVFKLPTSVEVGTQFECRGKVWRITAYRPGTRVLLARLINQGSMGSLG